MTRISLMLVLVMAVFVVDQSQAAAIARTKCRVDEIRVQQDFDMEQVSEPGARKIQIVLYVTVTHIHARTTYVS